MRLSQREKKGTKTYLRNQDEITNGNTHGQTLTISLDGTGANGEDLGLVLLLDAALGQEDAGGGLGLGLDALDQDAVQKGSEVLDVTEERLDRLEEYVSDMTLIGNGLCHRKARDWDGSSWESAKKKKVQWKLQCAW